MKMRQAFLFGVITLWVCHSAMAELWNDPEPVTAVNAEYSNGAPFLTYDGLSLYFGRQGHPDYPGQLFVATRATTSSPFGTPHALPGLDNQRDVSMNYPWVSADNQRLYYYQSGSPSVIKMSQWDDTTASWTAGTNVASVDAQGSVANPSLTRDELTIVFASTKSGGLGGYDIWMGTRADKRDPFSGFVDVFSVNSTSWDLHPRLSEDGDTLYFASNRGSGFDLYQATWSKEDSTFGTPVLMSFFDEPGTNVEYPFLSADGREFYFAKAPVGGTEFDIYVSTAQVPLPGAAVLGLIGLGYAGWRCRRRGDLADVARLRGS